MCKQTEVLFCQLLAALSLDELHNTDIEMSAMCSIY